VADVSADHDSGPGDVGVAGGNSSRTTSSTDGRSLRRERNRDAVIIALLELIREGNSDPGTSEIAERAGVSHRSVFRYFDDLDDLVRAAIDHEIVQVIPMAVLHRIGEGELDERIGTLLDALIRIYNYTFPVAHVARARSLTIPAIDDGLLSIAHLYRSQLAAHFAPELGSLDAMRADDLLDAIQVIVSFESFDLSRRRLGRSDEEIRRAWRSALSSLLRA